jgi:capsular polysaccharide biosynthesis protein
MTFNRFIDVLSRRVVLVVSIVAAGLVAIFALRNVVPNSYAGLAHVLLVTENGSRDPSVSIVDLPSVATSTVVLQRVKHSLDLPMPLTDLKSGVSASILGRSSIMAIGFRDKSADRAIAVSNAVADQLARYYGEISTTRYDANVQRLSRELENERKQLGDIDRRLGSVSAINPYIVSDRAVDTIQTNLGTLTTQRGLAQAQLVGDRAMADTTATGSGQSETARNEILTRDANYQSLRAVAAKDSAQLAVDEASYTSGFPGLPGERAKVAGEVSAAQAAAVKALTDTHAYSASAAAAVQQHERQLALVAGDSARLAQLDTLIAQEQKTLTGFATSGSSYAQLRAERDVVQAEYTALASRRANALANRAEAASLGNVVVLDRAIRADTQLAGGRLRAALVAFVLILALAVGTAFVVESFDRRIRRSDEIEALYGIPVVANVGAKA